MRIEFKAKEYTTEAGEYAYKLRDISDNYWVVHRRPITSPNVPPCWQVAVADGWESSLAMDATPRRFEGEAEAKLFVINEALWHEVARLDDCGTPVG